MLLRLLFFSLVYYNFGFLVFNNLFFIYLFLLVVYNIKPTINPNNLDSIIIFTNFLHIIMHLISHIIKLIIIELRRNRIIDILFNYFNYLDNNINLIKQKILSFIFNKIISNQNLSEKKFNLKKVRTSLFSEKSFDIKEIKLNSDNDIQNFLDNI
jgi:hypothetical protein